MWNGWNNYNAGSCDSSVPRENAAPHQQFSSAGTESTAPYCDLSEQPQARSQATASLHYTESITSSRLITSPIYMEKWLGSSRGSLSNWDLLVIRTTLRLIALQSLAWGAMAAATLLVFGTVIYKGLHPTRSENLHRAALSLAWPYDALKSPIATKPPH